MFGTCSFTGDSAVTVSPVMKAVGLPSASVITSVELTISGPGMNTIVVAYDSLPSSIELAIPSGSARTFELEVFVDIPIIAATSYKGTTTADLTQDSVTIYLTMGVGSTKIVVPDPEWNSGLTPRILQFDDISGLNGISLDFAILWAQGIVGLATFAPYDIDFDNQGRIYIANHAGSTESGFIRIDNITGINPIYKNEDSVNGIVALAVDRQNSLIYYADENTVYSSDLNGENNVTVINAADLGDPTISGLAVDNGFLYISDTGQSAIHKVNIDTLSISMIDFSTTPLISPWDVIIKKDKLYVANVGGGPGEQILEFLTSNLSLTGYYGDPVTVPAVDTSKGMFYGPRRFSAQLNDGLIIIDDYEQAGDPNFDKIIQMDNINGENWKTLPAAVDDDGQTLFEFFIHNVVV